MPPSAARCIRVRCAERLLLRTGGAILTKRGQLPGLNLPRTPEQDRLHREQVVCEAVSLPSTRERGGLHGTNVRLTAEKLLSGRSGSV